MATKYNIERNFGIEKSGDFSHFHGISAVNGPTPLLAGQAVRSDGTFLYPADPFSGEVSGLKLGSDSASGFETKYLTRGPLALSNWSAIIGNEELSPGRPYFLRENGLLSLTPPPEDQYTILVGRAQTPLIFDITLELRIAPTP